MGMTASLFIINNTSAVYGNFYTSFFKRLFGAFSADFSLHLAE